MKTLWLAVWLPLVAYADGPHPLRNAPPAFQAECASCHVSFPPQLLAADDWRRVMRSLDKHYGDNASLDDTTRQILEDFHVRNAGGAIAGTGVTASKHELPRITRTAWFVREHREIRQADWQHAKIKTPANCAACHTKAAEGSYREREIVMPSGQKWEN